VVRLVALQATVSRYATSITNMRPLQIVDYSTASKASQASGKIARDHRCVGHSEDPRARYAYGTSGRASISSGGQLSDVNRAIDGAAGMSQFDPTRRCDFGAAL
jgi:hypothetical protein